MSKYGTLQDRVRCKSLLSKVMTAEQTIPFFKNGMNLGWSGFTPAGYPKAVPIALANHVEKNNLQGKLKFSLFIGASVGAECEDRWASLNMIDRRWPYQTGKNIAAGINEDGGLILGTSCGAVPEILMMADKIILEVNTSMPSLEGIHDIVVNKNPPNR